MDTGRAIVIASCWLSLTLIASVYMIVFAPVISDLIFGVFVPIGGLVLAGLVVTISLTSSSK